MRDREREKHTFLSKKRKLINVYLYVRYVCILIFVKICMCVINFFFGKRMDALFVRKIHK